MKFNRDTCGLLRSEINAALKAVGEKHGVLVEAGNASFSDDFVNFKLRVSAKAEDGSVVSQEATDFKRFASLYGFFADDLGKEYSVRGKSYAIAGLKNRSRTMPIIGRAKDGKLYKFTVESVLRALGRECPDYLKETVRHGT